MLIAQAACLCPQDLHTAHRSIVGFQHNSTTYATDSPVVEPLSIDEAFLDMTATCFGSETMGMTIEGGFSMQWAVQIRGHRPCKFLAKLASDLRKPDGL